MQLLHHLVFADPDDSEAKGLQADAYEQLGYQAEVAGWSELPVGHGTPGYARLSGWGMVVP